MTKTKLIAVFALTILYLLFELAFNARLLDVVGGGADAEQVERIEVFGRSLSGIALALFVLQYLLSKRKGIFVILFCVGATGFGVYWSIGEFVDWIVETRSTEFRRLSASTSLFQQSLVNGKLMLTGMESDPGLYARPEGKAFLALFPLMAVAVDDLDKKTRQIKSDLVEDEVAKEAGGKRGYYKSYEDAMDDVRKQYASYSRIPTASGGDLEARQDKAWADYQATLAKRGWTPETVPGMATGRVIRSVQSNGVPVPNNWDPADEYTFRKSVERKYDAKMSKAVAGVKVGRHMIPPGLSYEAFIAHPAIQGKLREGMKLPPHVRVASAYRTDEAFDRGLYRPFLQHNTKKSLTTLEAPVADFEIGARYEKEGFDAARAVIAPALALGFSLLGAILHLGKLMFLTVTSARLQHGEKGLIYLSKRTKKIGWATLAGVVLSILVLLANLDNKVTTSRLYVDMYSAVMADEPDDTAVDRVWRKAKGHALHIVTVGQGYSYPMNEWVRTRILQNITYGYAPHTK